ncbi:universal stress protein [Halomonas sp. 328]|uniref:universal stress protein n=1 Tax=Halomonas sp. 328 TaxID=2776704 RepID=UPI0018A70A2B|nr:universal stress protein [Halomonas sp. 328]MBF8223764.1 universal stress protein [Halomonas sp. 328]
MYNKIMVPVDLAHLDPLAKALEVAADLARHYRAEVCYAGVTATAPSPLAHTPQEYQQKLDAFSKQQAAEHGQPVSARVVISHDPAADLDAVLVKAIEESGVDLVVMGTHLPRHLGILMPSHGGKVATHTDASILLVRP